MDGRIFEAVENDAKTILNAVKDLNTSFKTNNQKNYNKISSRLVKDLNSIPYVKKWVIITEFLDMVLSHQYKIKIK